ncbi:MAG: hypothetical protein J7647_29745 [Cyanobacteria bacterium SBLK]|nr:hypothetical protein [Cyanobacteria bacterium SBLK]
MQSTVTIINTDRATYNESTMLARLGRERSQNLKTDRTVNARKREKTVS